MEINATGQTTVVDERPLHNRRDVDTGFWPVGWWKLLDFRIGIIPLPVYVLLVILIVGFAINGSVPSEVSMFIAVLAVGGFTCAELGKRLPILRKLARRPTKVAAIALANKIARMVWAMMARGERYKEPAAWLIRRGVSRHVLRASRDRPSVALARHNSGAPSSCWQRFRSPP
jgi:hypothetical protein